jgi:hypothetical protein
MIMMVVWACHATAWLLDADALSARDSELSTSQRSRLRRKRWAPAGARAGTQSGGEEDAAADDDDFVPAPAALRAKSTRVAKKQRRQLPPAAEVISLDSDADN